MNVQLFKPSYRIDECLQEMRECLEKNWTGLGYKTVEFEEKWKAYTGLTHAHFLNSATSGLHLAVKLFKEKYGWDENAEIISTPLTFVSTNHVILYENLKVVFADVDKYLCLDPASVESRITKNTKAVIFVGMGGNTGQYEAVRDICKKHGLKLILDAAHMAGTRLRGKLVGHDADVTVFSFQAVKNLPTSDSGIICFSEKTFDDEVRKWTWLGINKDTYTRSTDGGTYKWYYDVEHVGFKYHGNAMTAALGLVGLKYLDEDNAYRRHLRALYAQGLANNSQVQLVPTFEGCESSSHLIQILVKNRDDLYRYLNENGIYPGVHYRDNRNYAMYKDTTTSEDRCPNSTYYSDHLLSLPCHLLMTEDDVKKITAVINQFFVAG